MGISYLKGQSWNDITREERLFCSHLYHSILSLLDRKKLIKELNNIESPTDSFENKLNLSEDSHWEVGYEVCFYRDLIFKLGRSHEIDSSIRKVNTEREVEAGEKAGFSEKRTFDLCLFSDDELVIVEAKAYQGLSHKQNNEFKKDVKQIKQLFNYLKENRITNLMPKVKLIILASSSYFGSKSFESEHGIGKRFINDKENKDYLCGLISWKQISEQLFPCDPIFERADKIYSEKANSKN